MLSHFECLAIAMKDFLMKFNHFGEIAVVVCSSVESQHRSVKFRILKNVHVDFIFVVTLRYYKIAVTTVTSKCK